jgi:hypothetical protein
LLPFPERHLGYPPTFACVRLITWLTL